MELLRDCLNSYAYQSLSKQEAALFEHHFDAEGDMHREFCQLFGPEKILDEVSVVDRASVARLGRYMTGCPLVLERLSLDEDTGEVLYRTRPTCTALDEAPAPMAFTMVTLGIAAGASRFTDRPELRAALRLTTTLGRRDHVVVELDGDAVGALLTQFPEPEFYVSADGLRPGRPVPLPDRPSYRRRTSRSVPRRGGRSLCRRRCLRAGT